MWQPGGSTPAVGPLLVTVLATGPAGGPGPGLALVPEVELSARAVALLEDDP